MIATQFGVCVLAIGSSLKKTIGKCADSRQSKYGRHATSEMFQFVELIFM